MKAWQDFDDLRKFASTCTMTYLTFANTFNLLSSRSWRNETEEYVSSANSKVNIEFVDSYADLVHLVLIAMVFGRAFLLAISYKHFGISRAYVYYQALFMCATFLLPHNTGVLHQRLVMHHCVLWFILFGIDFWPSAVALNGVQAFLSLFIRP